MQLHADDGRARDPGGPLLPARAVVLAGANAALSELVRSGSAGRRCSGVRNAHTWDVGRGGGRRGAQDFRNREGEELECASPQLWSSSISAAPRYRQSAAAAKAPLSFAQTKRSSELDERSRTIARRSIQQRRERLPVPAPARERLSARLRLVADRAVTR
jgi:hypothetical protein